MDSLYFNNFFGVWYKLFMHFIEFMLGRWLFIEIIEYFVYAYIQTYSELFNITLLRLFL